MRILFDHSTPAPLQRHLSGHEIKEALDQGWDQLSHGDLLAAAEREGFEVLITADKNIRYQQNLKGRKIAILELNIPHLPIVQLHTEKNCDRLECRGPWQLYASAYSVEKNPFEIEPLKAAREPVWNNHRHMISAFALIKQTEAARTSLIDLVHGLSDEQATFKPSAEIWSINEKIEHLVLAEVSGISKIWSAAEGIQKGKPVWLGDHTNRGKNIEEIIASTWKEKETAPPIATPHIGGPLSYWLEYLRLSRDFLERLEPHLKGLNLEEFLFPHFICGPLDAGQRIQFLTFHIIRHRKQIEALIVHPSFPVC